ncbi:MAG: Dabb family protein [Bacteroides sp.]|nr:Dabb family protein [Clostridia bacterium]
MIKHVILWKFKDELSDEEKKARAVDVKRGLEGLLGKIDGLTDIRVNIDKLSTSNADMMLDSTFVSEEALHAYAVHPEHVKVADTFVRPYTAVRMCLDYME